MRSRIGMFEKTQDLKKSNDKHVEEFNRITDILPHIQGDELFSQIVKLVKICKKLQIPVPKEYSQIYFQTKIKLEAEKRSLDMRISMSQINNVPYKHLEERSNGISIQLGQTHTN